MSLLTLDHVSISYDGKCVCDDVSLTVEKGDYLCIVGENGSGKSTLMKGMLGLKKHQSGAIKLGVPKNSVGYLPQQTDLQKDFPASIEEVVRSGCVNGMGFRPFYTKEEKSRAKRNMERLSIYDIRKKCYRDLSGGQQQRVLLARALGATTDLILLDEPVTGLDPVATNSLYEQIKQLNEEGITVIMVSHDIRQAVSYANKMLHMDRKPIFCGTTKDYVTSRIGQHFLEGGKFNDITP